MTLHQFNKDYCILTISPVDWTLPIFNTRCALCGLLDNYRHGYIDTPRSTYGLVINIGVVYTMFLKLTFQ